MTKQIQLKTHCVGLALSEVEALYHLGNPDAAVELILRSPFSEQSFKEQKENGIKTPISAEHAFQIAKAQLLHFPDHPIFNFVVGRMPLYQTQFNKKMSQEDLIAAEKSLLKIASPDFEPLFNHYVYASLAQLYRYHLDQPIAAMAWLAFAITKGSIYLTHKFLNNTFLPLGASLSDKFYQDYPNYTFFDRSAYSGWCLNQCALVAIILSGGSLPEFEKSAHLEYWRNRGFQENTHFKSAYQTTHPFDDLQKKEGLGVILSWAVLNDPRIFLDFFSYCLNHHFFPDPVCVTLLNKFIEIINGKEFILAIKKTFALKNGKKFEEIIDIQYLTDKAHYALFLHHAYQQHDEALTHFNALFPSFKDFRVSDFERFPPEERNVVYYELFKRLLKNNYIIEAIEFLKNMTQYNDVDLDLFTCFDEYRCFKEDYDLFKLRRDITNRIIHSEKEMPADVWDRAYANYPYLNEPTTNLYHAFISVFPFVEHYFEPVAQETHALAGIRNRLWKTENKNELKQKFQELKLKFIVRTRYYSFEDYQELYHFLSKIFSQIKLDKKDTDSDVYTNTLNEIKNQLSQYSFAVSSQPQIVQPSAPPVSF